MDIGQPKDYITGLCLYLNSLKSKKDASLTIGEGIVGPVVIVPDPNFSTSNLLKHPSAKIGKDCLIGPYVSIGPNVVVEDGVRLKRTSLFSGVTVRSNAWLDSCIVGWEYSLLSLSPTSFAVLLLANGREWKASLFLVAT